jgi:hypothetical protein
MVKMARPMAAMVPADLRAAARRHDLIAAAHERQAAKHRRTAQELRIAAARLARRPAMPSEEARQ